MNIVSIIEKKRDNLELTESEINYFISEYTKNTIPDYQAAAFLMASYLNPLNNLETSFLTLAMRNSGKKYNWKKLNSKFQNHCFADKHSTGGVGDKVSIILAPLAASIGLTVPMMSGRGLGHTGGTLDKLESIPGFNIFPTESKIIQCLLENNICMMGQSKDICPADKKLYSLRDVTSTVSSIPLIVSSIVSKKSAEGVERIVYDVKAGIGAFMKDKKSAKQLAKNLCGLSNTIGLNASAVISEMNEPLGLNIGNWLEINECIKILSNNYISSNEKRLLKPLLDLTIKLTVKMASVFNDLTEKEITVKCFKNIENGQAMEKFEKMVALQSGCLTKFKQAKRTNIFVLCSPQNGYLKNINSLALSNIGYDIKMLRKNIEDKISPLTGFRLLKKTGCHCEKNEPIMEIFYNQDINFESKKLELFKAFEFSDTKVNQVNSYIIEEL